MKMETNREKLDSAMAILEECRYNAEYGAKLHSERQGRLTLAYEQEEKHYAQLLAILQSIDLEQK